MTAETASMERLLEAAKTCVERLKMLDQELGGAHDCNDTIGQRDENCIAIRRFNAAELGVPFKEPTKPKGKADE